MENNDEYIIVSIEKFQEELKKSKEKIISNEAQIESVKKKKNVAIALSIVSMIIKFPAVFNNKNLLNLLFLAVSLIGVYYFYLKKEVLEYEIELTRKVNDFKVEMFLNEVKTLLKTEDLDEKQIEEDTIIDDSNVMVKVKEYDN